MKQFCIWVDYVNFMLHYNVNSQEDIILTSKLWLQDVQECCFALNYINKWQARQTTR
jgi:hypothetical protein